MSVIPQEDNLVMSFAEATRVFNRDQSNTGTFVPGTGDASMTAPTQGNLDGPVPPLRQYSGYSQTYPRYMGHPNVQPLRTNEQRLHEPYDVVDGPAAVVPPVLPTREQVAANPDAMVDIRHPNQDLHLYDADDAYSNPWFRTRSYLRQYFAEFLGTMVLVMWGEGTQAQVVAARKVPDDYLSVAWGWGVGFLLAIYLSSGISGGHINPAVTISLAIFRKFSWRKVPGYIVAQMLGGFAGAAVIFGVYYGPLHSLEGGYAAVLTTGPSGLLPSVASTFFSVFTGAALLMGAISVFTDTGNNPASPGMTPLLLGLIMVGIASSFGYQTGFVLNPARDLGPRLLVWATGVSGHELWLEDTAYGIWTPLAGTISGALFGNFVYDLLIYNGRDSPLNFDFGRRRRRRGRRGGFNEKNELSTVENGESRLSGSPYRVNNGNEVGKANAA